MRLIQNRSFFSGLVASLVALFLITVLFYLKMDFISALIPLVSLSIIFIGSISLLIGELNRREEAEPAYLLVALLVLGSLFLLGRFLEILGLASSIAAFLFIWWIALHYRAGGIPAVKRNVLKLLPFSILGGAIIYLLFVKLLGFYIPNTLLF